MAIKIDDLMSRILSDPKFRGSEQAGQAQGVRAPGGYGPGRPPGPGAVSGDTLSLSGPIRELMNSGLDLEQSRVQRLENSVAFDLAFSSESTQIEQIRSNGTFSLNSQSIQLDFSFRSALTVTDEATGEQRQEMFQFELHLEASQVEMAYGDSRTEKEDIGKFALDILKDVAKLQSEGKKVDGIELKGDDLRELGGMDGGKLLKRIVHTLGLMRAMDGGDREGVTLRPERNERRIESQQSLENQTMNLSLSVQRLSQQTASVATDEPTE